MQSVLIYVMMVFENSGNEAGKQKTFLNQLSKVRLLGSGHPESWNLNSKHMNLILKPHKIKGIQYIELPKYYYQKVNEISLKSDYVILIPIAKTESIDFIKNIYSDMNIKFFCDADDTRENCDFRSESKYQYNTLTQKTFDMFNIICNNTLEYKTYLKMDFDAYIDKKYVNSALKLMIDNEEKHLYYGVLTDNHNVYYMQGRFYGTTRRLLQDFCEIKDEVDFFYAEDVWFGNVTQIIRKKIREIGTGKDLIFMGVDETKVIHKKFKDKGVYLHLGRHLSDSEK
ncbi:hypothetical protein AYI68_g5871 [Smittium mucronatum]|uniref:Uncharacterized protein n=1 Tax=Smittium mucronatum TaxID=133383 RepID=A0A1R0GT27_9FUNG|nr:hypothetical protein AYI68_g5871 [Smittium mucronatum]